MCCSGRACYASCTAFPSRFLRSEVSMATTVSSAATAEPISVTPDRIYQMAWGYAPPLILEAAIRQRVFDVLDSGPKTVKRVSQETGASERGLAAIMNALIGFEFLSKDGDEYSLTP